MILAGDIGGTKTRLALFPKEEKRSNPLYEETLQSQDHDSLIEAIRAFLKGKTVKIESACFGIAGPIIDQKTQTTNLSWFVDAEKLKEFLGIARVRLLNDLEAIALGTLILEEGAFSTLNKGASTGQGNRVVIAAGTGLGEGILFWDGTKYCTAASEGGHCDFAPRSQIEIDLLSYLLRRHKRVSYERILSGPGLLNIYEFLKGKNQGEEPRWLSERFKEEAPGTVISEMALAKQSELCMKALDLFVSIYGAEAGNLALKMLPTGGVYIGGGIAPKILKKLSDGSFLKAFFDKGRYASLMERLPIRVILNDKVGLLGAAHCSRFP